ncbi:MAG: anaerobic ribonucleoside-triphosphate reductase activating protein [Candidatus Freyarchaeota archaeon]
MKAYVYGILDISTIDYPQKPAMVIFVAGCSFRCPMCHNWRMLDVTPNQEVELSKVLARIEKASPLVEAVKVSGGEPTLYPEVLLEIANFCERKNLSFGFDTNGFFPENIKKLVNSADLISIDIKAPFNDPALYSKLVGFHDGEKVIENLMATLETVFGSGSYADLRTTVIPSLNDEEAYFKNIGEVLRGLGYISKAEKKKASYTLQEFEPANAFSHELKKIKPPSLDLLVKLAKSARIPQVYIRHKKVGFMKPLEEIKI